MARVTSAGLLLFRRPAGALQLWIAHMGGPFWAHRQEGAWSIPKGEYLEEQPLAAALREFQEEIGAPAPQADYVLLGEFPQSSRKLITVFAAETDFHVETVASDTFELEWPPRSGRIRAFPEIDDARWVGVEEARRLLVKGQHRVLDALQAYLEALR